MPADIPGNENTYIIDAESGTETARLIDQDRLITKAMGGIFPEHVDLSNVQDIVDIGCGPGGWVLDVAYVYPKINVVGIDISQNTIQYAHAHAQVQGLDNASFGVMDALKPLDFSDSAFDFVNARMITGFMPITAWPSLLQECLRITRPGGMIRLTEPEIGMCGITNSPACEKLNRMGTQALKRAGHSFSPDGQHVGTTPVLRRLLYGAGYQNIHNIAYALDFSVGTEAYEAMRQNVEVAFQLLLPFMLRWEVTTQEEFDQLYQQMVIEMLSDTFCGLWYFLSIWGKKPE